MRVPGWLFIGPLTIMRLTVLISRLWLVGDKTGPMARDWSGGVIHGVAGAPFGSLRQWCRKHLGGKKSRYPFCCLLHHTQILYQEIREYIIRKRNWTFWLVTDHDEVPVLNGTRVAQLFAHWHLGLPDGWDLARCSDILNYGPESWLWLLYIS